MLKYVVIILDDSSVSFCHYKSKGNCRLISYSDLQSALLFAMRENLNVQVIWPDYELNSSYHNLISSVDNVSIASAKSCVKADVTVCSMSDLPSIGIRDTILLKTDIGMLSKNIQIVKESMRNIQRLNIQFEDIEQFSENCIEQYRTILDALSECVMAEYLSGHQIQINILTDRMMLDKMNNCNAGVESLTIAPDGRMYICPAFYYGGENSLGDCVTGYAIPNQQLYKLDHAPICRICDAWHCNRCAWMNKKLTLEVNTPGRQQCIMAHLEREASRKLNHKLSEHGFQLYQEIPEIKSLDPFEIACRKYK